MTPQEWRDGIRRLGLTILAVTVVVGLLTVPFSRATNSWQQGLANATALVAVPFLLGGVAVHLRGDARVRSQTRRQPTGSTERLQELKEARRSDDRLALGLLTAGAVLFVVALTLG